ncbi:GTP pyrophosphokinase [Corynebacterium pyruviciproducens]|uniref:GTP pyrophosphokinase n=1 Tax=Corynebacterium pyruviciproducens TaxID=598660 RepID=UPI00288AB951|nr:GTP pyrophosphokinase family protein [Corynebacterium pyruviciproducens]
MTKPNLERLEQEYVTFVREHPTLESDIRFALEDCVSDAGIAYDRVDTRIKSWRSFAAKAAKCDEDSSLLYPHPWEQITDVVGARIITYHSTEIPRVIKTLEQMFTVLRSVDKAAETRISGGFGYGSHHLIVQVTEETEDLESYAGLVFEVQLRTILQHAWAEFEHDIRYKGAGTGADPVIDRSFTLAAGLIELADQEFDQIAHVRADSHPVAGNVPLTDGNLPHVLTLMLGDRFPRSKSEVYPWLEEILTANGVRTVADLEAITSPDDVALVLDALQYQYVPSQVRLVDDLLLARFGPSHIARTGHSGYRPGRRPARLQRRLKKLQAKRKADDERR